MILAGMKRWNTVDGRRSDRSLCELSCSNWFTSVCFFFSFDTHWIYLWVTCNVTKLIKVDSAIALSMKDRGLSNPRVVWQQAPSSCTLHNIGFSVLISRKFL